ncbi:MAG: glycosyltransferase family 39 protein [Deltaproteobacteria bacterium]
MSTRSPRAPWERASLVVVLALCAAKAFVHLALVTRYGYHGDELYFLECGRHLAFGYVDHPPLIPWIARLAEELGGGLVTLRLPAIAAGTGTLAFTALLVREWRGQWRAQLLALLCLLVAPAQLRTAAMLDIPVVEVFLCTLAAYLVARALCRGERWSWIIAGGVLGLATLAKHSSLLWGGALLIGLLAGEKRGVLATRWPWLGVAVAFALFAPNLVWQADHGFPTLEFMRTLRHDVLAYEGRGLFLAGQLLYFHPVAAAVWMAGLVFAFTRSGREARPFAWLFLILLAFFFFAGGKPYYLASAYPPVLAAGGVALERWLESRITVRRTLIAALASTGLALGFITLPILPLARIDAIIGSLLGWAVPPMALTHDLHGMLGWEEHAAVIDRAYRSLPEHERCRAGVLAGTYSQASAVNQFRHAPTPRAVSGNLTYHLWGPDGERGDVLIAYGVPRELLERHYRSCSWLAQIAAPEARPQDRDLPVYVCREPLGSMADLWPELRQFGHGPPEPPRGEGATLAASWDGVSPLAADVR